MPFTLAHPAAVLPLLRWSRPGPLVPAALVAGSLAPDVPYFLPLPRSADAVYEPFVNATTTHAWPGALTVAVPTAAVLLGLWWLVRPPLLDLVGREPAGQEPTGPGPGPGAGAAGRGGAHREAWSGWPRRAAWVVLSLAVGVLTHVAWDAVTHGDGVLVRHVAWLREPLLGDVPASRVLQHVSTVGGLLALAVWCALRLRAWHAAGGRVRVGRGGVLGAAVVLAAGIGGAVAGVAALDPGTGGAEAVLSAAAKSGGAWAVVAGLAVVGAWYLRVAAGRRPG